MKKIMFNVISFLFAASLTACTGNTIFNGTNRVPANFDENRSLVGSSVDEGGKEKRFNVTMSGGGEIGMRSMTADDRSKMSRALDAGTGKSTTWTNGMTGISYTVTPTRKLEVRGNPFCRQYNVIATKGSNSKTISDTACVTTDGSWHSV